MRSDFESKSLLSWRIRRNEHGRLLPRFKQRRNGEWCSDKLHQRAGKVDEKLARFVKQPYNEFRWLVNSSWRFNSSQVHGNADTLLEQVTWRENEMTIQQKYDAEDAAAALYIANLSLSLVLVIAFDQMRPTSFALRGFEAPVNQFADVTLVL